MKKEHEKNGKNGKKVKAHFSSASLGFATSTLLIPLTWAKTLSCVA